MSDSRSEQILAIDIGAGTQDILLFDPDRTPENCFRMVMPSQTQVVGSQIRALTEHGGAIHLTGTIMGGGASTEAVRAHVEAGLPVSATPAAARTIHNDPDRVRQFGIAIVEDVPSGATVVELADLDLPGLRQAFAAFNLPLPERMAIAVQDHGVRLGTSNNDVRGDYLHWLVNDASSLESAAFSEPPAAMTRMRAVQQTARNSVVMDTGAAAVLGALRDARVAEAAERGAVLVNIGNMHTFAILLKGRRVLGVFEHHSSGISSALLDRLVSALTAGELTNDQFRSEFDGHGATIAPAYLEMEPFDFVAITGPNRGVARELGWYQAAPHGDMMLTGSFGLVDGYRAARGAAGR